MESERTTNRSEFEVLVNFKLKVKEKSSYG